MSLGLPDSSLTKFTLPFSMAARDQAVIPRHTFLPPPGRPRWQLQDGDPLDLLYLSWGGRWLGDHPVPLAQHEGWVYAVVLEGTPGLVIRDRMIQTRRGDVFLFHPDCAYGWQDGPGLSCRLLCWLWRTPPAHSRLVPAAGGFLHLRVNGLALRRLAGINRQCQRDVIQAGETEGLTLRRAHLDLDICLAAALRLPEKANPHYRITMALNFLRQNPAAVQPVKGLCEYLQVSPATLRSLFQTHCGKGPQAVALEMRMERAQKRLAAGNIPVKEIAYELGYRHPNDFSRAYKRYFGASAVRREK